MSLADYHIVVWNPTTGTVWDIVTQNRWLDMRYTRVLNGVGSFSITVPSTDNLANLSDPTQYTDYIFDIYRNNALEDSYLLRHYDLGEVDNQGRETVILGGVHLNDLLARRRIVPEDDPLGSGGFSTKSGNAALVMSQYIGESMVHPFTNLADRKMLNVHVAPLLKTQFHTTYQRRSQQDILLEVLQDIAVENQVPQWVDFRAVHQNYGIVEIQPYPMGTNRTYTEDPDDFILFSTRRGNLVEPRLKWDRKNEITAVWVGGEGIAAARVYFAVVDSTAIAHSPYNRIEEVIDARSSETFDEMQSAGDTELAENQREIDFEFDPLFGSAQSVYNVDWVLGDGITVAYNDYTEDHRISVVKINLAGSKEKISVKTSILT